MRTPNWTPVGLVALLFAACSGGGGDPGSVKGTSGDFVVLRTEPQNNGRLFLNEPIRIDFSNEVDLDTADLNTVSFQVFDLNGVALNEQPVGTFSLARSAGDEQIGRRLVFSPRFPTTDTYDDGGFRPGRRYVVQLVGGDARNGTVLRDIRGKGLKNAQSFAFTTADGASPSQLFRDTLAGGPRKVGFEVSPATTQGVGLNKLGLAGVEIRLQFDQPLNPHSENVPVRISADPLKRSLLSRGRIFLEYDDATGRNIWIPATVDLEVNALEGSEVVLRPIGVLPNNAEVRVIVENTVEDMSGESNVSDASYDRVFDTFTTRRSFEPQYDAIVEDFEAIGNLDFGAPILEPLAELKDGKLAGSFNFGGSETGFDYEPNSREVILNTDFTQIVPKGSPPINVAGGVFKFDSVRIPDGVLVRGTGTRPMVWLATGDFVVEGMLQVDGGLGGRVDTLNSANFPTPGGIGSCGGGNGGRGSPNATDRSPTGEAGFGPGQRPGGGGEPGQLSCQSRCGRGSAGGGGSYSTKGDPYFPPNSTTTYLQMSGEGGRGCTDKSLAGGQPGQRPFIDSRNDNDFWGAGVNVWERVRISGELLNPLGGSGGGGGGDRAPRCTQGDPGFISDNKGGGGGGGGGVLIVKALGRIVIGPKGQITATGGHGGGGEQAGGNNQGAGGGGGSGGMVVLMSGDGIDIVRHGNSYGEGDYSFAIAADGGIGTQGQFSGQTISSKYPPPPTPSNPTGGFGGLGVVQLMVPPGDDADGTGSFLDDNIRFLALDGTPVSTADKIKLLAWRGWPDSKGVMRDDKGNQVTLPNSGKGEGDIRPSPILLPAEFGAITRARSIWIDTGASARRRLASDPGPNTPRVVVTTASNRPNPDFAFAGTRTAVTPTFSAVGYSDYTSSGQVAFPAMLRDPLIKIDPARVVPNSDVDGQPAYRVSLARALQGSDLVVTPANGFVDDMFAHHRAELVDASGTVRADFRILQHDAQQFWLSPDAGPLPTSRDLFLQIRAKFFEVSTNGEIGLGAGYPLGAEQVPFGNVRVAFAFHTDPADANGERFPADPTQFTFDLQDPALLQFLENKRPTFVQWDVLFNSRFHPTGANAVSGEPLRPDMPRQALEYLVLPYRW